MRAFSWRPVLSFAASALAAVVIALPVVVEQAVEHVSFSDELGTFPVEVGLSHDGRSTLDTGLFGRVFWSETGPLGFGGYARATGPPEAGGTLASYVDQGFIATNVALIDDPDSVVSAYSSALEAALRSRIIRDLVVVGVLGGALLFVIVPRRRLGRVPRGWAVMVTVTLVVAGAGLSSVAAAQLFHAWPRSTASGTVYSVPGVSHLGFGSPETREVAIQVQPFIEKNTQRIAERAARYEDLATSTFDQQLGIQAAGLEPREGETIVLAEADPQGSQVGARVRTSLYKELFAQLGSSSFALRTISGDVSSNGTVAESTYIGEEARVSRTSGDVIAVPTVAVGGDHDTEATWKQMRSSGIVVPDLRQLTVAGLHVAGANDREHKSLFGGLVRNGSGLTEQALGTRLRTSLGKPATVDESSDAAPPPLQDGAEVVLLHQPDAAAGYLGLKRLEPVRALTGSLTVPYDDGIPDQRPGIVNIGHLHELDGPWVLWNTDGPTVTWTVVNQLGTAGGVENAPTFSRFSTPISVPLKPLSFQLQYLNIESGLETGFVEVTCGLDGRCVIADRVEVGLPGGLPGRATPGEEGRP